MFSNNSVMDLPHFGMHSSTTKSKCQTQHRQQQHPLFLSDITNSKPKSISWLKNNKQHQHISFVPFSSGFSSPSPPPLKHLPLSDRRNQPLPTLPTYSSSPSPPLSPSLSSPTSAVTNNKTIDNCSSLLPTPGSYRRMQDDSFLKFLEQKGTAKSTTSSHGIKSKNKRSTTSSSASVRSLKVDNSGDSTYGSTTLRSLPSVSTPLARHSPSSVTRSHQPSALPIRNTNRARSSSSPPSPPIKEVTDLILTELSATPTSMPTPPTSPSMATAIASSLSTPMVVSPSSSSSSSTSTSSASSAMNSLHNRNKYNKAAYPLTQNSYEEQDRLVAQHYLLRTAFHGNDYMATVMTPLLQQGCVVLDMGCGSGTWTMELATAYPASHFIGLDQLALFPKDIKPKNCHFATCDLTSLPLSIPDASVDYIFQRDLNWALLASQWPALIKEYMRILKPGGWIELMEMVSEMAHILQQTLTLCFFFLKDIESQSSQRHERMFNDKRKLRVKVAIIQD